MKYCLVICLLLAGCSKRGDMNDKLESDRLPEGWQMFITNGSISVIVPVTMSDGTRCVVLSGNSAGKGISCDWSKTK